LARESIDAALSTGGREGLVHEYGSIPAIRRSSFVTLRMDTELRGCCGSIEVTRPLAEDLWHNARAAAFRDPRFPSLTAEEWPSIHIYISVLSELEVLTVASETHLVRELQAGEDGLILELGAARATFLPSVWEQIPDPAQFVRHLKFKAGWSADFWSPQIRVFRYTAESFGEEGTG
jgi:hypothetical protein